jgi:hypothetical protein
VFVELRGAMAARPDVSGESQRNQKETPAGVFRAELDGARGSGRQNRSAPALIYELPQRLAKMAGGRAGLLAAGQSNMNRSVDAGTSPARC